MYEKIGQGGGRVGWTANLSNERVDITATWYSNVTDATVYVIVQRGEGVSDADRVERRGTLKVERGIIPPTIFHATVSSLSGDVKGEARNVKGAVEEYASKVAQIVAHEWARSSKSLDERLFGSTVADAQATAGAYAEALGALSIVEADDDQDLVKIVATLKYRLAAAIAHRDALRQKAGAA